MDDVTAAQAAGEAAAGDLRVAEGYASFLERRRAQILERVEAACARAGRPSEQVEVIAVSKTVGLAEVVAAHRAGYAAFGENRPQELRRKTSGLAKDCGVGSLRFDMIGNLQKNKINQVLESEAFLIHSISSLDLARAVSRRAASRGAVARVLLEVNVSGEASKAGMDPAEARSIVAEVAGLPALDLRGVMAMAPAGDPAGARRTFSGLRELRDELRGECDASLDVLSCGMSDDFEIAIEEGSTLVRLGRVVFDPAYALG